MLAARAKEGSSNSPIIASKTLFMEAGIAVEHISLTGFFENHLLLAGRAHTAYVNLEMADVAFNSALEKINFFQLDVAYLLAGNAGEVAMIGNVA
jgi:hypothetical protein